MLPYAMLTRTALLLTFALATPLLFAHMRTHGASTAQQQGQPTPAPTRTTPLLIVVNQGDRNISLIDPVSQKQVATISEDVTDVHAHEAAASPDGRFAYLPIYGSSGVGQPGIDGSEMLIVDLDQRKITGAVKFETGVRPHCVVYDPVSKLLYVTTELTNSVTVVDPQSQKILGTIPTTVPQSHMLAISHDGKRGYTANVKPGTITVLDMPARKSIMVIPISAATQRISISNDDKWVFTSDQTKPQLAVIDTASNQVTKRIPLPGIGYGTASTRDGKLLLVCTKAGVAVVDLASFTVVRTLKVEGDPQEVLVAPTGDAYVSSWQAHGPGKITVIDPTAAKVTATITAGNGADGLAWASAPSAAAGDATQKTPHAESQSCLLNEAHDGTTVTLKGRTVEGPHDLGFAVDGCSEDVLLTYAGDRDSSVPLDRLHQDKNLKRFKKFTESTYPGTKTHPCEQCAAYGPTEATLVGQLEMIGKGVTRDKNGILFDAQGKRIWKQGFGHPVPLYMYRLAITSVESATAQKLPAPEM
ncbi:MAG: cytochrome D1 domain-containing protein [Candidatus Acidiferrales bacterium]